LNVGPLVGTISFFSAIHHISVIILIWTNKFYQNWLEKGTGYLRWFEYSITTGIMIVFVGITMGMNNYSSLVFLFGLNASIHLFSLAHEKINSLNRETAYKMDWSFFVLSILSTLILWVVLVLNLVEKILLDSSTTIWVYSIFGTSLIFYILFPINLFMGTLRLGPWKLAGFDENVYVVLSLVSKIIISWQMLGFTIFVQ
jgi:hypothetical protein